MSGEFAERLDAVYARMAAACERVGRGADDVQLVAVAKTYGPDAVTDAAGSGVSIIGENRVQEACQKAPLCPSTLEWHMIGHVQTNKVRPVVELFSMIHSVDSLRLLEAVDAACEARGKVMPVCLQVNVSGESSKHGMAPDDVPELLGRCERAMHVDVVGLMTIPPFAPDPEDSRRHFTKLRELRDAWRARCGFDLPELSMGMSGDFEVAIEEGATLIRVGSILFGQR